MILANRRPPRLLYALICLFVGTPPATAVFTYGRDIYVPSGNAVTPDLIEHEHAHWQQQGRAPWLWWARYLLDRRFRLRQETAAYRAQVRWFRSRRIPSAVALSHMAASLAGPLYGNLTSPDDAWRAIGGR